MTDRHPNPLQRPDSMARQIESLVAENTRLREVLGIIAETVDVMYDEEAGTYTTDRREIVRCLNYIREMARAALKAD